MKQVKPRQPIPFKLLDLGLSGRVAGSAEPGGSIPNSLAIAMLEKLKDGESLQEAGIPEKLIANLEFIKVKGIKIIASGLA